jgi:ferredoxin-NADP reductase
MAFVQSVTGKKPAAEAREAPRDVLFQSPPAKSTPADETADENRPAEAFRVETFRVEASQPGALQIETLKNGTSKIETAQVTRSSPVLSDVRQEIRGRVAAFRAHQELFHRERNEYCESVLTRVRASTGHALKAPDDQPSKP